jgi:serine/threonine protein kinase
LLLDKEKKRVKIDDFGIGRALQDIRGFKKHLYDEPGADLGSTPPEAFVMRSRSVKPLSADIYSLGVTFYRLTTAKDPFEGEDFDGFKFAHLKKYPIPPKVHRYDCPEWLDEMILKCLEKDPDQRWRSATEMEMAVGKAIVKV